MWRHCNCPPLVQVGQEARPQASAVVRGPRRETYDNRVTILGLFELTMHGVDRPHGRSELAAAKMAVNRINQLGLIKGYTLQLIYNDTKCDPGAGVDAFFHALYALRSRLTLLLGSACEDVSESVAKVVPYWNIVQTLNTVLLRKIKKIPRQFN
ncbi:uncharacterized protein LOC117646285 [Thrips palmi]|uniref:Uncharacterized protein LOC117646285 n=1 Tax=Thrips palmi TaxID=161013 RepID=A0A6P8ZNV6_THRPL|nr:uncharacterized protein LOC117646285 [Thrips palmi]